jgi:hypothetical protein
MGIDPALFNIGIAMLSAAFAAGGAWLAVRTELKYLRRDVEINARAIEKVEDRRHSDAAVIHDRVTRLNERMTAAGVNGPRDERR